MKKPELPALCRSHSSRIKSISREWTNDAVTSESALYDCGKCRSHVIYVGLPDDWSLIESCDDAQVS